MDGTDLSTDSTATSASCGKRVHVNGELQVGVELQAVAVRIAHVELTCAPAGVGDLGAIDNPRELLRQGVNVLRRKPQDRSVAGDAFVVVPLHRKTRRIARDHRKPRCVVVVAKDLHEPEPRVEGQGSAHVSHHEHGLDSIELFHTRMLLPSQAKAFERDGGRGSLFARTPGEGHHGRTRNDGLRARRAHAGVAEFTMQK